MKYIFATFLLSILCAIGLQAQEESSPPKFYLGAAYGTSFPIGNFKDADIANPDAGFAKNGRRIDAYGGYFLDEFEKMTLTAVFRYQTFETGVEDIVSSFREDNPGIEISASTGDWQVYSLLLGVAYRMPIGSRIALFPRVGVGPMLATNPGIMVTIPMAINGNNFERSSERGLGLGYEIGLGLKRNLGKHFALMPTFTFSGGFVSIKDVVTTIDNVASTSDSQQTIQSFNVGLSLAYQFY
ncbi:MAG: outer membrane beta-barrel protein [Bacteroidota bacterium]